MSNLQCTSSTPFNVCIPLSTRFIHYLQCGRILLVAPSFKNTFASIFHICISVMPKRPCKRRVLRALCAKKHQIKATKSVKISVYLIHSLLSLLHSMPDNWTKRSYSKSFHSVNTNTLLQNN